MVNSNELEEKTSDTGFDLKNVYVNFGKDPVQDIIKFDLSSFSSARFMAPQPDEPDFVRINFTTTDLILDRHSKQADGSELVALTDIVKRDFIVYLHLAISGWINTRTGKYKLQVETLSPNMTVIGSRVNSAILQELKATIETAKEVKYEIYVHSGSLSVSLDKLIFN